MVMIIPARQIGMPDVAAWWLRIRVAEEALGEVEQ
jgi:hypothetical protein